MYVRIYKLPNHSSITTNFQQYGIHSYRTVEPFDPIIYIYIYILADVPALSCRSR